MRCSQVNRLLDRYADGSLTPALRDEAAVHFAECAACSAALERARHIALTLASEPSRRAPGGLRGKVMEAVYREALVEASSSAVAEREAQRGRFYRRLALCFMISAAVLAVSLALPRSMRPSFSERDFSAGGAIIVKTTLLDADRVVRGTLAKPRGQGNN